MTRYNDSLFYYGADVEEGSHSISMNCTDWAGREGTTSLVYFTVAIPVYDTTPPWFTNIPASTTLIYGSGFDVQFIASDNVAIDSFSSNDSEHAQMNPATGRMTNNGIIPVGVYYLNISRF